MKPGAHKNELINVYINNSFISEEWTFPPQHHTRHTWESHVPERDTNCTQKWEKEVLVSKWQHGKIQHVPACECSSLYTIFWTPGCAVHQKHLLFSHFHIERDWILLWNKGFSQLLLTSTELLIQMKIKITERKSFSLSFSLKNKKPVSIVLPHWTEVMTVVKYLTSDADSYIESPHNSLLTLAWSSDSTLSSKQPRAMYTAVNDVQLGPHDSEINLSE